MDMKKVGIPALSAKTAQRLLDLLCTDDAFRELFVADVSEALRQIGHPVPDQVMVDGVPVAGPGSCWVVTQLASKDSIRRDREKLQSALGVPFGFIVTPSELLAD